MLSCRAPAQVDGVRSWLDSGNADEVLYIPHGSALVHARWGGLERPRATHRATVAVVAADDLSLEELKVKGGGRGSTWLQRHRR